MEDLTEFQKIRREKLNQIKELGINPYPFSFERTHFADEILENYEQFEEKTVSIAGRIMAIRKHGKAAFCHVMDSTGKIQIYLRKDQVQEKEFELFK
ncbi:MAG: lysine--tRNA ligase, partial [Calditrichaeota bacterium]